MACRRCGATGLRRLAGEAAARVLRVPSLCPAWTVHGVLAHLVSTQDSGPRQKLTAAVRARGSPARTTEVLAAQYADRPPAELLAWLRAHVDSRFSPPGMGPQAALTDVMVHRVDVAVPLGIALHRPPASWVPVLAGRAALVHLLEGPGVPAVRAWAEA